ncbi:MAG: VWA domain-containing protein [Acidobacteriota bacterium]
MISIRNLFIVLLLLCGSHLLAVSAQAREVYYLLDNSGSMYDGYPAPRAGAPYYYRQPAFQEFLRQLVAKTARPEDRVSIITFNRVTNRVLPPTQASAIAWETLYAPVGKLDVVGAQSPDDIKFTRMPNALSDLLTSLASNHAVIWILTDNVTDQGGSQEALDTREFYTLLAKDPRIQMIYAYPMLRAPINTKSMLMLYGIVVGPAQPFDLTELKQWEEQYLGTPALVEFMAENPFQMKPLDRNTLELSLKDQLKLDEVDENSPLTGSVDLVLSSRFNYHTISSAGVQLQAEDLKPERASISAISGDQFSFSPTQPYLVKDLQPKSSTTFHITFRTPRVEVSPSRNRFATLWADIFDESFVMQGALRARVNGVQLRLELPPAMQKVFGASDIPEIFRPQLVDMDELRIEFKPAVYNSGGRLLLFLCLSALLAAGLIAFGVWFFLPQNYYLSFDDNFEFYRRYSLRRKGEARVKSESGEVLGRLCRGWSNDWRFLPNRNEFKRVSDSYSNVALARAEANDDDIAYRLFVRTKRPTPRALNEDVRI